MSVKKPKNCEPKLNNKSKNVKPKKQPPEKPKDKGTNKRDKDKNPNKQGGNKKQMKILDKTHILKIIITPITLVQTFQLVPIVMKQQIIQLNQIYQKKE